MLQSCKHESRFLSRIENIVDLRIFTVGHLWIHLFIKFFWEGPPRPPLFAETYASLSYFFSQSPLLFVIFFKPNSLLVNFFGGGVTLKTNYIQW